MMKKRTRRILALIVIVVLCSDIETVKRVLVVIPIIQLLLFDYDQFFIRNFLEEETGGKPDDLYQ